MKPGKILLLLCAALLTASCGTTSKQLYYWGPTDNGVSEYELCTYNYAKNHTPQSVCALVCAYERMVSNPGGQRKTPPPGICAEYGYFLLLPDTAGIFAANATKAQRKMFPGTDYEAIFKQKAGELFEQEATLYPESQVFLKPLISKIKGK